MYACTPPVWRIESRLLRATVAASMGRKRSRSAAENALHVLITSPRLASSATCAFHQWAALPWKNMAAKVMRDGSSGNAACSVVVELALHLVHPVVDCRCGGVTFADERTRRVDLGAEGLGRRGGRLGLQSRMLRLQLDELLVQRRAALVYLRDLRVLQVERGRRGGRRCGMQLRRADRRLLRIGHGKRSERRETAGATAASDCELGCASDGCELCFE